MSVIGNRGPCCSTGVQTAVQMARGQNSKRVSDLAFHRNDDPSPVCLSNAVVCHRTAQPSRR